MFFSFNSTMKKINKIFLFFLLLIITACSKEEQKSEIQYSGTKLLINEVMTFDSPNWIEIYNPGEIDVYMEGFHILFNNQSFEIKAGFVPAKGFALFFCDAADFANHTNFVLNANGGTIILSDKENKIVDILSYPQINSAVSYGRKPDGSQNIIILENPTPITTNSPVYIPNQAPVIDELILNPQFPTAYQVVTIDVHATDDYGIDSLMLFYESDGFDTIVQFNPSCCDPRKMAAEIKGLPAGSFVNFYVKAVDDSLSVSYYPVGAPLNKMSYTVSQ